MRASYRNALAFAALITISAGAVGCQKQRAENSLQRTAQILGDIEQRYDGRTFEPQRVENLRRQLEQAQSQLATDAGAALSTASAARTEANLILETVRPRQAEAIRAAATEEIRIAVLNDMPRFDPPRFERVRELDGRMQAQYSDNRWDDVINLGQNIIREVDQGLAPLRTEAERARNAAENKLNELRVIGGQQFAPEAVTSVETRLEQARNFFDRDRDFVLARNRFAEASSEADAGILRTKNERSRLALERIEGLLTTALIEGGDIFLPREYSEAIRLYEASLANYQAGNFDEVLQAAELLEARSRQLVVATKRAASDERIAQMDQSIQDLENGGVLTYLPNSTAAMRGFLAQARQIRALDTEPAFDQIRDINVLFTDEFDRVRAAFAQIAEDTILRSRGNLETTRALFDRLQQIFDPIPGDMSSEQRIFEDNKELRRTEISNQIQEANQRLIIADERFLLDRFRDAIVSAEEVAAESARLRAEIFHVAGHNAIIELGMLISRFEREGARLYAPAELARSTRRLEEVKELITNREFERSVQRAAEARADVELMAQRIAGRATENVREARQALTSVSSDLVRQFRAEDLIRVADLIDEAQEDLQADRLKLAVERAQAAIDLARQAERESFREASRAQIDAAGARIIQAQDARAEAFAGRAMDESRRLLTSARALFTSGDFVKALELARLSEERATAALFSQITAAETEIATANSVGGWEFNNRRLAQANEQLIEARQALERGEYSRSRSLADSAASNARSVANGAKQETFRNRIARIRQNLNDGAQGGLNLFQPDEAIQARRDIVRIEGDFNVANFDQAMRDVEQLEARLRIAIDGNDNLVMTIAEQQSNRLDRLEQDGALAFAAAEVASARDSIRFARLDFESGAFRSAHGNLRSAIITINEIEERRAIEDYAAEIDRLLARFGDLQNQFANVLSLSPMELRQLALGPGGGPRIVSISAKIQPADFRAGVEELYNTAILITPPAAMRPVHERVIMTFSEARLAALGYERLTLLNRLSEAEATDLINRAIARTTSANRNATDVQILLNSERRRIRLIPPGSLSNLAAGPR